MRNFRKFHLLDILEQSAESQLPIDAFLRDYFYQNRAIGSHDRKEICEVLYRYIRWKGLIDFLAGEEKFKTLIAFDPKDRADCSSLPSHIRCSFPENLFMRLENAYGAQEAMRICLNSNEEAPITLRVNRAKTTRDELMKELATHVDLRPSPDHPDALFLGRRINLFSLPEFKEGHFEVQDLGSQIVANFIEAQPKEHVLDYCAGSGGKTLAFAPKMRGKGQIYLHDVRSSALTQAKKRLKRAGIQNAQIVTTRDLKKNRLRKKMDWVLCDVPCSGTGTLRRNPDMKWRFDDKNFEELLHIQREIVVEALQFLKPGGHLVYATCSILPEENQQQIDHFLKTLPLELIGSPFASTPEPEGMDGFFAAKLKLMLQ